MIGIAIVAVLGFARSTFAWIEPINISNTSQKSNEPRIAIDKYNYIHVIWEDFQNYPEHIPSEILYRYFDGDTWSGIVNVSRDSTESWTPRIAVDTMGYPHVIWEDWGVNWDRGKIYYSYFNGDSFTTSICLSDSLQLGNPFARMGNVVADSLNHVNVVWCDYTNGVCEVYYTSYDGDSWSTPVNVSNSMGASGFPEMAIDSDRYLHVVWKQYTPSEQWDSVEIYYSKYEGNSWSTPVNASNLVGESRQPHVSADLEGNPHVVWEETGHTYRIYYSFFDGSSWSAPYSLDSLAGERGYNSDIMIDSQDNTHTVWTAGGRLYYAFYNGVSWSTPFMVSDSSAFPNITASSYAENLYLVWAQAVDINIGDIYYSRHNLDLVDIEGGNPESIQKGLRLTPNCPNPFTSVTKVSYTLNKGSYVTITISNLTGQVIKKLNLGYKKAGLHTISIPFDFLEKGDAQAGIYFCRLKAGEFTITQKMIMVR